VTHSRTAGSRFTPIATQPTPVALQTTGNGRCVAGGRLLQNQTRHGGHVGSIHGPLDRQVAAVATMMPWLSNHAGRAGRIVMADPVTLSTLTMRRPARRSPAEQRSPGPTPGRWPPPSSRSPRRAWPTMATVPATADMADNPKLRPRGPATPSTSRSRRPASTPGSQARPTDPAPLTDRQAVRWQPTRPRDRPLARGPGGTWPTCACRRCGLAAGQG
jgi:hypothetical protein